MNEVLDAVAPGHRALIVDELKGRNPNLIEELTDAKQPTDSQSDAIIDVLADALSANYGPGHTPNAYGLAVERALDAYLEIWPIHRWADGARGAQLVSTDAQLAGTVTAAVQ